MSGQAPNPLVTLELVCGKGARSAMPRLFVTTREGDQKAIDGAADRSVMQMIRDAGIDELMAICGGSCSCATCQVYVDPAQMDRLQPMSVFEDELLSVSDHRRPTSRLSCQIAFNETLDGLRVTIAPED